MPRDDKSNQTASQYWSANGLIILDMLYAALVAIVVPALFYAPVIIGAWNAS